MLESKESLKIVRRQKDTIFVVIVFSSITISLILLGFAIMNFLMGFTIDETFYPPSSSFSISFIFERIYQFSVIIIMIMILILIGNEIHKIRTSVFGTESKITETVLFSAGVLILGIKIISFFLAFLFSYFSILENYYVFESIYTIVSDILLLLLFLAITIYRYDRYKKNRVNNTRLIPVSIFLGGLNILTIFAFIINLETHIELFVIYNLRTLTFLALGISSILVLKRQTRKKHIISNLFFPAFFISLFFAILHAVYNPYSWIISFIVMRSTLGTWMMSFVYHNIILVLISITMIALLSVKIIEKLRQESRILFKVFDIFALIRGILVFMWLIVGAIGDLCCKLILFTNLEVNGTKMWALGDDYQHYGIYIALIVGTAMMLEIIIYNVIKKHYNKGFDIIFPKIFILLMFLISAQLIENADFDYYSEHIYLFGSYFMRALGFLCIVIFSYIKRRREIRIDSIRFAK